MQLLYIKIRYPHITNLMHTMMTISRSWGQSFYFGEGHIEKSKRIQKIEGFLVSGSKNKIPPPCRFFDHLLKHLNTVIVLIDLQGKFAPNPSVWAPHLLQVVPHSYV